MIHLHPEQKHSHVVLVRMEVGHGSMIVMIRVFVSIVSRVVTFVEDQ